MTWVEMQFRGLPRQLPPSWFDKLTVRVCIGNRRPKQPRRRHAAILILSLSKGENGGTHGNTRTHRPQNDIVV